MQSQTANCIVLSIQQRLATMSDIPLKSKGYFNKIQEAAYATSTANGNRPICLP